ncbi:hypothetical protein Tco_0930419 [Tanacetum coccineum]
MARLEFCDKHNMVAYLVKSESSEGFDEIIDFLTSSHIYYALTENPIIFVSLIEHFWETAVLSTTEEGLQAISATIDGHEKLITEASLRRHLKLEDAEGISSLSNEEIFEQLAHMGIDGLEKDLQQTKKTYSTALTKLILRGRKISQINEDPTISLVQDEGISWIPQEEEVHEKPNDETEVIVQEETPTEIIEEHRSGEKGEMEISTASPPKVAKVSIVEAHVYIRRSAKDKGNAIMEEPATPKKVKKRTQVQLSMDEELARKMEEEERARFNAEQEARALQEEEEERLNLETARELKRQLDQRQEVPTQSTQSQGIDWNDLSVLRYHALKNRHVSIAQARRNMITYLKNQGGYKESYFKRMSYNNARLIFEMVWDHVNTFIPIGSEVEKDSSKPSERETSKTVEEEKVKEEDVKPEPVLIEKKAVGIRRKTLARRRASDKQGQDSPKRQKKEKETADYEEEKDELRMWLTVVTDEEEFVDPEILHTRFPIVDWESQSLYSMHVYKIIRVDGNTSYHKTFKSMLKSFDRHDLEVLQRLVMERFQDNTLEGYNLMLWEKKYPLTKETLQKMLNWKLEAEAESSMAFELIKFTRSQIEEKQ